MSESSLISFVARSKRRKEIMKLLLKVEKMSQSELMKISKQYKSHNSRTLKELVENKLIICLNPKDRVFRFYKITSRGKAILKEVERIS